MDIAIDVIYLLEHSCTCDHHLLHSRYRSLLLQRGFLPTQSKIRVAEYLKAFLEYYPPSLLAALHSGITPSRFVKHAWFYRILHFSENSQNPLRHILAIRFLGSSVKMFFRIENEAAQPFGKGPWPCLNPVCEHYRQGNISSCHIHYHKGDGRPMGRFCCSSCLANRTKIPGKAGLSIKKPAYLECTYSEVPSCASCEASP